VKERKKGRKKERSKDANDIFQEIVVIQKLIKKRFCTINALPSIG
jgi:hypothetical protein